MIYLILSILLTAGLFVAFRLFDHYKIPTLQAIVVNYFVCLLISAFMIDDFSAIVTLQKTGSSWLIGAGVLLGFMFILMFNLMAFTTQNVGLTATSVASKIAMVVPVLAAIFVFKTANHYGFLNYFGIVAAIAAVVLCSIKKEDSSTKNEPLWLMIVLPVAVFLGSGTTDTLFSYTSNTYLHSDADRAIFASVLFAIAGFLGLIGLIFKILVKKEQLQLKSLWGGVMLGIPNYFSIYTLLKTLEAYNGDGAFVFPVANVGVILVSAAVGLAFFQEKLLLVNKLGLLLSVVAIALIAA